ncbi:TIGR02450 family Trp-rich protein [Photobacterium rosenbergii]|uniref:TIGR02450 family Trp-rich protein n=1 Tax=Photobacterium rosenbergii TaxID=294936 RepID=A0ABU3ZHM0_9GAMM|nr:TIGR02450 family Trp-rich protein [Photobacterium rosenbergii]MDV5169634.1 TIGR02450 family Trp-rich protein [Photobacterium rosenbergii]
MNRVHPKSLYGSKWTKVEVAGREKHFMVIDVEYDENQKVVFCLIQAVINHRMYELDWRELKDSSRWLMGWK